MYFDNTIAETIVLPPGSSFTEMPWLLRVDLNDPAVQAELRRQMAIAQTSPDDQLWDAEVAATNSSLYQKLEADEAR